MTTTFFISDTHFNHNRICEFEPVFRPFASVEEHDEELIKRWNDVVGPNDTVVHLGDVILNVNETNIEHHLARTIGRLNGRKELVFGNHDTRKKIQFYTKYFEFIGYHEDMKRKIIFSHIPVHTNQVESGNGRGDGKGRFNFNVHGHLHSKVVCVEGTQIPDKRFINVSCERINLTPISFDELMVKHGVK